MVKLVYKQIEVHCTKITVFKKPPRRYGKGVGAEADTVAGILAGSSENIRSAVAEMRGAIEFRVISAMLVIVLFPCI